MGVLASFKEFYTTKQHEKRLTTELQRQGVSPKQFEAWKAKHTQPESGVQKQGWTKFYEGAWPSNHRRYLPFWIGDSNVQIDSWSRLRMLSLARYLYGNSGIARSIVDTIAMYSVGSAWQALPKSGNAEWDLLAREYFNNWGQVCDIKGMFTWNQILNLTSKAIDIDGDVGFVMVRGGKDGEFPMLQAVEGHRITDEAGLTQDSGILRETKSVQGVRINDVGRPVGYTIQSIHPLTSAETWETVQAQDFIHLYRPERLIQYRGITSFAHAINGLQDMLEIASAEKDAVKAASVIALLITTETGVADDPFADTPQDKAQQPGGRPTEAQTPGEFRYLRPGEKLQSFTSDRPGPAWHGLMEYLTRDMSVGFGGLPIEFCWDASKLGGTSQRFVLEKAQRVIEERQILLQRFAKRVYVWVIAKAIKSGALPSQAGWQKVAFTMPRRVSVDYGRDRVADQRDYVLGLSNAESQYGEYGLDWQEELRQKAIEQKFIDDLCKEYGITPDRIQLLTPNGNSPTAADVASNDKPQPKPNGKGQVDVNQQEYNQ